MKLPENMYPNGHPNNNTTESRREFEEWKHKQGGHYMSRNNTLGSDLSGYQDPFTEGQWKAWQAARAPKIDDNYCPLSDPNHPYGKKFIEESPPIYQSEIICRKCGLREERGEKPSFDF
jgi:hypothetical protein